MNKKFLILVPFIAGMMGCSSHQVKEDDTTHLYVENYKMNKELMNTAGSVDTKLNELLTLERGSASAAVNKNGVIDTTIVAGHDNASDMANPYTVPKINPEAQIKVSNPDTQSVDIEADAVKQLRRQTRVTWNGRVDDLLLSLSKQSQFEFKTIGVAQNVPQVKVMAEGASVAQVLRMVADQLDDRTDINVITKSKTIVLIYK